MTENSFARALDLLDRINHLEYRGAKLMDQTVEGYNVWIFFQSRMFSDDLLKALSDSAPSKNPPRSSTYWISGSLVAAVSALAVISQWLLRKKVIIFSIDKVNSNIAENDARLDDVYSFLRGNKISFIEYFHTTIDRSLFRRLIKRRRLGWYIRTLDFLAPHSVNASGEDVAAIDYGSFSAGERAYVKPIVEKYIRQVEASRFKIRVYKKLLSITKPKVIFSIDSPRDYSELVAAAQAVGVPFVAFQHGHFTKYHVGWLSRGFGGKIARPAKLVVWSEFWKEELLKLGTYFASEEIIVGGQKSASLRPMSVASVPADNNILTILVPYETDSLKSEVKKYLDALLADATVQVYFKLRTDVPRAKQLLESGLSESYHPRLFLIEKTEEVLGKIRVVAGTYSTFLYDMVAYLKPLALLDTHIDFGEGLVRNGFADKVFLDDQLVPSLKKIAETSLDVLTQRKDKLIGENPAALSTALQLLGREYSL